MRVISGTARGRPLKAVPGTGTRPTTDKVKEALFSMIGPYFDGGWALDLFAGSGGLGIEALSRGVERCVFVDADRFAVQTVQANVAAAGVADRAEVYRNEADRALKALEKRGQPFRLVFLDPPYKLKDADRYAAFLMERGLLEEEAVVVIEHEASHAYADRIGSGLHVHKRAEYGDTAVTVYGYKKEEGPHE